ncbi:MAG: hypothetical protein ACXADH_00485 [Candidatus Kariarchaeaceae archaeon]|jgi:hypothetical protein
MSGIRNEKLMQRAADGLQFEMRKEVSKLNKTKDRYVIALARLSDDGMVIDYNCEAHNFPLNDMPLVMKQFPEMIKNQHQVEMNKLLMSSEEKAELKAAEDLKSMLE